RTWARRNRSPPASAWKPRASQSSCRVSRVARHESMSWSRSAPGCRVSSVWSVWSVCWVIWLLLSVLLRSGVVRTLARCRAHRPRLLGGPREGLTAQVDVDALLAHVRADAFPPLLHAETAVPEAGEGGGDAELLVRVHVDGPRDELAGDPVDPAVVSGPDAAREPVVAVVRLDDEI